LNRAEIETIAQDQQKAIVQRWSELRSLIGPALGAIPASPPLKAAWPDSVKNLFSAIKDIDGHILQLFTDDASSSTASASTTFETELNACREAARTIDSALAGPLLEHSTSTERK
jgi:hypothetical protein